MGTNHDHRNVFEPVHSMPVNELAGFPHTLEDSPAVSALRGKLDYASLMDLAAALCRQLRYRDALEVYDMALVLYPDAREARLKRAVRLLTSLQVEKAIPELKRCRDEGETADEIGYRLGLSYYYAQRYPEAMEALAEAYPFYDGEMGVATMYWHTMAALRYGADPALLHDFREDMDVGHHIAYKFVMSLLTGTLSWDEACAKLPDPEIEDLDYAMMAYGMAVLAESKGDRANAEQLIDTIIPRDGFWIGFGYLAAWNDRNRLKRL